MLRYAKITTSKIASLRLTMRIQRKWMKDRRHLPLTSSHYQLYEIIHRHYWLMLKDFPNLINCRDFNDRMQWLKLFDQSREIIRCSDKILVRDYVRERVGERYLLKLYQTCDHFSEIDLDALPNSFVVKANHDSGTVILVRDKFELDHQNTEARIEAALSRPFGWENGEWAYAYVQPRVLVEEFITPEDLKPPPDYKFYCVEGRVKFCHFIYDRGLDTKEQTVDIEGNDLATALYPSFKLGHDFKRPKSWGEMIEVAAALGRGFKCVRVDLFCTDDRIYAGEMTFWPMAGCYKGDGQKKLGRFLDFDRKSFKPFLLPQLDKEYDRCSFYPNG